jgi:hypothetical protein
MRTPNPSPVMISKASIWINEKIVRPDESVCRDMDINLLKLFIYKLEY